MTDVPLDFEHFALPEAEESEDAEEFSEAKEEFTLTGLQDLQSSLSALLKNQVPNCSSDTDTLDANSTPTKPFSPPPGLDLPPGLECPSVESQGAKGPEGLASPPGLETKASAQANARTSSFAKAHSLSDICTTVMLRNIPNKYSQDRLVEQLHSDGFKHDIDFLYLPIDFKNLCNVGYAFLNFRTVEACHRFAAAFHNVNSCDKLPGFRSKKICEVAEATCQGCDKNVSRLQSSPVMAQLLAKPEWLPRLFDVNGKPLEFPMSSSDSQSYQQAGQKGMSRRGRTMSGSSGKGGDRM